MHLGTIALGGPAAHIALMDDEVVKRHQWLSRKKPLGLDGSHESPPRSQLNRTRDSHWLCMNGRPGKGCMSLGLVSFCPPC
ncbi:chromate transporter [Trichothermofontia sp.]